MALRYVITEEPTEAEPLKFPRLVGRTNDLVSSQDNCKEGEILVATELDVNLQTWEGARLPTYDEITETWIDADYSNDTKKYCVSLIDGVPTVVLTADPT